MADGLPHPQDYERSDASATLLAILAAGVGSFVVATPLVLAAILPLSASQGSLLPPQTAPPRLQTDPAAELSTLRRNEAVRLSQYGWISRSPEVLRLPIDRAIALTVERGLPGWQKP